MDIEREVPLEDSPNIEDKDTRLLYAAPQLIALHESPESGQNQTLNENTGGLIS